MAEFVSSDLVTLRPRATTVQLSRGRTAFTAGLEGMVARERPVEGLYVYDTRVIARYQWRMNGKQPAFSGASNLDQASWLGYFIQAPENWKETPAQEKSPLEETLELRLTRHVGEGMHEDVQLTNHTQVSTGVRLELQYALAFESQDEAESGRRQQGELKIQRKKARENVWEQEAQYTAEHAWEHQGNRGIAKLRRGVTLRIENADSEPEFGEESVVFGVRLEPHGTWHACVSWIASVEGQELPLTAGCPRVASSDWDQRRRLFLESCTNMVVPRAGNLSTIVGRVLHRSRLDVENLRMYDLDTPGGIAVAAGVPTYMEVFGRDMQAAGWQAAMMSIEPIRGSLNVLQRLVARETNDWRDAAPGRIPHDLHTDPLSELNFRPKSLYYGSVTSCSLFPIGVSALWHWTGDLDAVRPYVETALGALRWADTCCRDDTGFYRYQTKSEQGVKNQGWKDSSDAIVHADGSQAETPIGTCEMQGFLYAAKLHFSEVMWWLGERETARRLYREAKDLKERFNERFWMEDEGFVAMGIDGRGDLIRSVASDPGHCVLSGILDEDRVKRVAWRLLQKDLFSGWGIRTLSTNHPAYNPFSYHRGSVWPATNAGFVLGFSRYGLHGEMHQVAKGLFESAALFQNDRLPEVFGGHPRTAENPFPGLYSEADYPQAWSASAPIMTLQALLGIYPYAPANVLFLDPHLPEWLPAITLERLRVGKAMVTLRFSRTESGATEYEIAETKGTLHVIRQPSPWSLTTGWAERIRDAVESLVPHRRAS